MHQRMYVITFHSPRAYSGSLFYTYCKPLWGGIEVVAFILKIFAHGIMLIFCA